MSLYNTICATQVVYKQTQKRIESNSTKKKLKKNEIRQTQAKPSKNTLNHTCELIPYCIGAYARIGTYRRGKMYLSENKKYKKELLQHKIQQNIQQIYSINKIIMIDNNPMPSRIGFVAGSWGRAKAKRT